MRGASTSCVDEGGDDAVTTAPGRWASWCGVTMRVVIPTRISRRARRGRGARRCAGKGGGPKIGGLKRAEGVAARDVAGRAPGGARGRAERPKDGIMPKARKTVGRTTGAGIEAGRRFRDHFGTTSGPNLGTSGPISGPGFATRRVPKFPRSRNRDGPKISAPPHHRAGGEPRESLLLISANLDFIREKTASSPSVPPRLRPFERPRASRAPSPPPPPSPPPSSSHLSPTASFFVVSRATPRLATNRPPPFATKNIPPPPRASSGASRRPRRDPPDPAG